MEEENWYIKGDIDGEKQGPYADRDQFVMLETNEITSETLVSSNMDDNDDKWTPLIEVESQKTQIINDRNEALQRIENYFAPISKLNRKTSHMSNVSDGQAEQSEEEEELEDDNEMVDLKLKKFITKEAMEILAKKKDKKEKKTEGLTNEQIKKLEKNRKKANKQKEKKKQKWYEAKINTNVYVQGQPPTLNQDEFKNFMLKAGVLRQDPSTGEEKVKLYTNPDGTFKGDAQVGYSKEESVGIAIEMLSDREMEPGYTIHISKAEFSMKGDQYKKREQQKIDEITKIKYKTNQEKMLTWDEDAGGEGLRIVIVKNMFTPELLMEQPELQEMIREDIVSECEGNTWKVRRLTIFEFHPLGVVEIKFERPEDAQECIKLFHNRYYGGKMLDCDYYDGKTNYKNIRESEEAEQERIDTFGKWLEEKIDQDELFESIDIENVINNMELNNEMS